MAELLSKGGIAYIVARVLDNAQYAMHEKAKNPNDEFLAGKVQAYYEVLDTIKNELIARDEELKEYRLDMILEQTFY